ncbi:stimulus-sensing domain-containing protein [uncultured Maritalea sp.]|uniref:stimulus-sensing domain-containing protein n=1 Tax=uncultured Maritalea sp. TaxID=757249 RepID=UPI00260418EF|nr:stimulus-sensing domain-containing protein [uncultured Maritalea sp.]
MTPESASSHSKTNKHQKPQGAANGERVSGRPRSKISAFVRSIQRVFGYTVFSSLTRRIVVLNLAALAALVIAILYLNQWRAGLIDARVVSLRVQGEIIAGAIAASATVDSDVITVDPDKFLQLQGEDPNSTLSFFDQSLEFPINPERVAPLLRNLITPTGTRARIYDRSGLLILDSDNIYARGEVLRQISPATDAESLFFVDWWNRFFRRLRAGEFPRYQEYSGADGAKYPEVRTALSGATASIVRVDVNDRLLVSVAVPVRRLKTNVGVLLLSTAPGDIDHVVEKERWNVFKIFLIAASVTTIMSLLLAGTIAGPMRRLSAAAQRVRSSMTAREEIPDYTDRPDEIGHLSGSLRDMTNALYNRIEAIESFAADVAHELKNPLTSLRSAVETLPVVKNDEDRLRLTSIIQHDVRRLDRLITDISKASRLDAELAREEIGKVNISGLVATIAEIQSETAAKRSVTIELTDHLKENQQIVPGHEGRLAQVVTNLIDNAVSFSPEGAIVEIALERAGKVVNIIVKDQGRGIRGEAEQIFKRFYTDRPTSDGFGNHSGLGLSISQQIVEAHRGTIQAQNRTDRSGAEFIVRLPTTT